jgi:hypothetical protein
MTTQTEALNSAIEFAEYCLEELDLSYMASNQAKRLVEKAKEALSSPNGEAQPEQEPVAWRYKPARENNPRWEYTTEHPLDMGDGYLRPSLVEYCKCIEPLYAKEKPKLMLEKFREMNDLLDDTTPPQRTWVGLTDEEFQLIYDMGRTPAGMMEMVEAKLKEKNA